MNFIRFFAIFTIAVVEAAYIRTGRDISSQFNNFISEVDASGQISTRLLANGYVYVQPPEDTYHEGANIKYGHNLSEGDYRPTSGYLAQAFTSPLVILLLGLISITVVDCLFFTTCCGLNRNNQFSNGK